MCTIHHKRRLLGQLVVLDEELLELVNDQQHARHDLVGEGIAKSAHVLYAAFPEQIAAPTQFEAREWQTLQFAPLWVFSLTAGIDNDIDQKEIAALSKELAEAGLYRNGLARMVLYSVGENLPTTMEAYAADGRDSLGGLTEVADLLDRKLPADESEGFKKALLTIGVSVCRASGGEAGGDPVSDEEKMALMLIAGALRTQL